uniref:Uncharacterized protein n=1 Tax=Anopheles merus TaxID=30066 RepID=A0A182UME4_ANOME
MTTMLVSDASSCRLWERLCRPEPDRRPRWLPLLVLPLPPPPPPTPTLPPPPTPLSSPFSVPLLAARSVRYWLNISPVGLGRSLLLTTSSNASSFSVCSAPQIICSSSVTFGVGLVEWRILLVDDPNGGVDWAIGSCISTESFVPLANEVVLVDSFRLAGCVTLASRSAVTSSLNISQCPKLSRSTDLSSSRLQYISTRPEMAFSRRIGAVRSMAGFRSFTFSSSSISCSTVRLDSCTFDRSISIGGLVARPLLEDFCRLAVVVLLLRPLLLPSVECCSCGGCSVMMGPPPTVPGLGSGSPSSAFVP